MAERRDADLIRTLEAANIHPLWDRYQGIIPPTPSAKDRAMHWRWQEVEPLAARAAAEVAVEDVERRALIMVNPAFGGATGTTGNLIGAFTVLQPGDHAPPHRHTAPAIRFGVASEGAATIVNGRRCAMAKGDLVLTPQMCWHGHINEGDRRTLWFDALASPLTNLLDGSFFEPGLRENREFWRVDEGEERLWEAAGMVAANAATETQHSPKFHYSGGAARRLLEAMAPGPDGAKLLRYTNPVTGGSVMSTMDCFMMRLVPGRATLKRRATFNAVCFVASGSGRTRVGEESFAWSERDIFTIPHWQWASHEVDGEADIFMATDRAAYERLGLLREEMG